MTALLLVVVALPAVAAFLVPSLARGSVMVAARASSSATGIAFGLALVLAARVAVDGPVAAVLEDGNGRAIAGLYADQVAVLLLLLVMGVSAVVQVFASRYLRGDRQAERFAVAAGLLTTSTAALVSAATLLGLAIAWTAAGIALCVLIGLYSSLPAAREGVRRTARAFVIADGALWLAVLLATAAWGSVDLRTLGTDAPGFALDGLVTGVVACLIVVAAIGRSAQLPLQRWLSATLAAPTPVSALLHAGVVNGGGVLLVKLSPLFAASAIATHVAFTVGAATVVYGTTLMLVKTDIKGSLALSTVGQMGFMVMTCGLGAFAAAVFHLVAHGMYKASLFLGSGSAVGRRGRHRQAPPSSDARGRTLAWIVALAVVIPAGALATSHTLLDFSAAESSHDVVALLVFAWVTAGWASVSWLRIHPTVRGVLSATAVVAVAAPAYVVLLGGVSNFLAPALEGAGTQTASPWLLVPLLLVLAAVTALRLLPARRGPARWQRAIYLAALNGGQLGVRGANHRRPRPALPSPVIHWNQTDGGPS